MKIAFIIQHLTNGGAERTISNLSLELSKNHDVSLIVFDGNNCTYPYGGKLLSLHTKPTSIFIGKIINVVKRVIKTRKIRKQEKFDCVISFMFGANLVNILSRQNEKVIISERNHMSSQFGLGLINRLRVAGTAKFCDADVALSKKVSEDLINEFRIPRKKVVTIYNPVDLDRIKKASLIKCNYVFDRKFYYFVTAGRFVTQKGQWHLIKAFSLLVKDSPFCKLLILGDGPLRNNLEMLVSDLGMKEYVSFLGFQDNPYSFIAKCNCFVLPSIFEGLGNVIIEAMACGVPVISYDCLAGPRELLSPESNINEIALQKIEWCSCGILVPPPASSEPDFSSHIEYADRLLCEAMIAVSNSINREKVSQIVNNSYARIEHFSPERIINQWEQLIKS